MAKAKRNISEINGFSIYHEPNVGTLWYDIFTKKGYIMVTSDLQQYLLYNSVLPIGVLIALLLYFILKLGIVIALIGFILINVIGEIYFRYSFFYKLPVAKNWSRPQNQSISVRLAERYSATRLVLLMILLYIIFGVSVIDAIVEKLTPPSIYINIGMAIVSLIFAIIVTIAKIKKK